MYLWSTNLCTLLGAITWCCIIPFSVQANAKIVPEMNTPTHTLFNSFFTDYSTIQCYIVLVNDSVGKWTINTDMKLSHINFFWKWVKVLLTMQLYHNCSNALHEIKIDRCLKHCWGGMHIHTCKYARVYARTHTHTLSK
jgi:hypothetical protein